MDFTRQPSPSQPPPKNWLVESILVTIFCCLPFGIAGIVYASQVNAKYSQGDYAGAVEASNNAGKWTKIGFFVSLALWAIYLVIVFAFGGWAIWNSQHNNF